MELLKCYSSDSEDTDSFTVVDEYNCDVDVGEGKTGAKVVKMSEDDVDAHECDDRSRLQIPAQILALDPGTHPFENFKSQFNKSAADKMETVFYSKIPSPVTSKDFGTTTGRKRRFKPMSDESDHVTVDSDFPEAIVGVKPESCSKRYLPQKCWFQFLSHKGKVNRLDWSKPGGCLLASASMDSTICIWDPFIRKACLQILQGHSGGVREAKWNAVENRIISCSYDKTVILWDVETGKRMTSYVHPAFVTAIEFHPKFHSSFISGCFSSQIASWDLRCKTETNHFKGTDGQVQDLEFLLDGSEFLSATDIVHRSANEKALMAWDFRSTAVMSHQIFQEPYTCTSLKVHSFREQFIAQTHADYIAIFASKRPYKLNKYRRFESGHQVSGYPLACSIRHDGQVVGTGSSDGSIVFYDYFTSQLIRSIKRAHSGPSTDVQFHPVSSAVASCGWDCAVNIWK